MRFALIGLSAYFAICGLGSAGYYGAFAAVCGYLAARHRSSPQPANAGGEA